MEARQPLLLALNAGGSSLKAKLYTLGELTLRLESSARLDGIGRRLSRLRIDDVGLSVGAIADHARAAEVLLDRLLPGAGTAAGKRVFIAGPTVAGLERQNWRDAAVRGVDAILTDYAAELARQIREERWADVQ